MFMISLMYFKSRRLVKNNMMLLNILLPLSVYLIQSHGCTTFIVGKKATVDGSVIVTHTNDGGGKIDPRLVKVPAHSYHKKNVAGLDHYSPQERPIYYSPENYPRYVGYSRNVEQYYPENCEAGPVDCNEFKPTGYIPQVPYTYSYYEETYAVMNEKQVALAESTCSSVFVATAISKGGKALLSVDQLSQIAMERASTARGACEIMGSLAQEYGFYGESSSYEGGAESLLVSDPTEGWVFHVLADPTGSSAIWVAARVPDDGIAVVANMFSIRDVNLSDSVNFLGRKDMWDIAKAHNLWKPGMAQDFTATFSDGEYAHKYYSGRRMWRIFDLVAPSRHFNASYGNLKTDRPYPFSVKPDHLLSVTDCFSLLRDWYNDTDYSTSVGMAAGAFGTPDRYNNNAADNSVAGNWERTIALYRTSDSFAVQSRSWLPDDIGGVLWFGPHSATGTVYTPLVTAMSSVPDCLADGWPGVYNMSNSYWVHRNVANLIQVKFLYMIHDVRATQRMLEAQSVQLVTRIHQLSKDNINAALSSNILLARNTFTDLLHKLFFKYADGFLNQWVPLPPENGEKGQFTSVSLGYPTWWLENESVDYSGGPPSISG